MNTPAGTVSLPPKLALEPRAAARGDVVLPGSKSMANRALLMAALCETPTHLSNLLDSDDTRHMRTALTALGVRLVEQSRQPHDLIVAGCGGRWPRQPEKLYLGNAGTAMRPLVAVLSATTCAPICLTGEPRMLERPLQALIDALREGGAELQELGEPGFPPVEIAGGLTGGTIDVDGSVSSQFISALLMALPLAPKDSLLNLTGEVVSWPYIELTVAMLAKFGIDLHRVNKTSFMIPGGQSYQSPEQYWIEGDASAASYWLAAGVLGGGPVAIDGAGSASLQGDVAFATVLQQMGGCIEIAEQSMSAAGGQLHGIDVDLNEIPDAAMTLAVLALFAKGQTRIRNVANWRVKETDRLTAMATELRKVGAKVTEHDDGLTITPPAEVDGWQRAEIATYNDHRMAMCFALLAFSPVGVTIQDPACCSKTYPNFFSELERLSQAR